MSEPDTTLPTTPPHPAGPDLSRLDQHLGDVMVEAEIARTALAAGAEFVFATVGPDGARQHRRLPL